MAADDLTALLDDLKGRTRLTAGDALAVRRLVFGGDWRVSPEEAEALVALNARTGDAAPEWNALFVDAMTEYAVRQQAPVGYVDETMAQWLVDRLGADGKVWRASELEAVTHILEQAASAPASLAGFALEQARMMLTAAERPLQREDVELLRRMVFAPASFGSLAVSREEAEALFDINDAVRGLANDPAWTDFFARAIGNAVLAATPHPVQSRAEALRQDAWLHDTASSASGFFGRLVRSFGQRDYAAHVREDDSVRRMQMERSVQVEEARLDSEVLTGAEAGWIRDRIGRDGQFDENEAAAIRFIEAHANRLDATLPHAAADAA